MSQLSSAHGGQGEDGTMHDLGTLGGAYSSAFAINESGLIVGESETRAGGVRAFVWTEGGKDGAPGNPQMKKLPTLGGYSRVNGLNEARVMVGFSEPTSGVEHAVLWTAAGKIKDLGNLGGEHAEALAIDDHGQVVGVSQTATGAYRAFRWSRAGGMIDLGSLGGLDSFAAAINASGDIVGGVSDPGFFPDGQEGAFHAALWRGGVVTQLPSLGGENSLAGSINDDGVIVGASEVASGEVHATMWIDGRARDLGTLGGDFCLALGVNAAGEVAGDGTLAGEEPENHAWLWSRDERDGVAGNRRMRDLGTLGGTVAFVHGLNDRGDVVGGSTISGDGEEHAFVWVRDR